MADPQPTPFRPDRGKARATSDQRASVGPGRRLVIAASALVVAVVATSVWGALVRTVIVPEWAQLVGVYLVVWVPLGVAIAIALLRGSDASELGGLTALGLRIRWIDLLWGAGVGLIARGIATVVEISVRGSTGTAVVGLDPAWAWFVLWVAPVVLAPIVEETFFRGLVLGAVRDGSASAGAGIAWASVVAVTSSAVVFGLLHTLDAPTPTAALIAGSSALVLGVGCGVLAVLTGRIGGAIVAHAVFNAALVLTLA